MLLQAAGHEVVGSSADGDSLVELLAAQPADVAILDIRMPPDPDGGLVTAERLRAPARRGGAPPVVGQPPAFALSAGRSRTMHDIHACILPTTCPV
jgi:DNA-binding NarL/FixJ family response regulator